MDSTQIFTLITGSGGAMAVLILWVRSMERKAETREVVIKEKDEYIAQLTQQVISLSTDVQRSLREQSGCRFDPRQHAPSFACEEEGS